MKTHDDLTVTEMTEDPTEAARRRELHEINAESRSRDALEAVHGQVCDTSELTRDFTVFGFLAPYAVVCRKEDNVRGTVQFQHSPRFYFNFQAE